MFHYSDVPEWSSTRMTNFETPLLHVAQTLRLGTKRYGLIQSKQQPQIWTMLDYKTGKPVILTHAFVVKWTTPLDTGNYVPAGEHIPEGLNEDNRKTEPGLTTQLTVAYDCRMDSSVGKSLADIEKWVEQSSKFNPNGVPRSQWMTPSWILSNAKFIVNSQIFSVRSPFNSKDEQFDAPYGVHPWISKACVPHNSTWIPNPNRVRFYDAQEGTLVDLNESRTPSLKRGDLVKMMFRMMFSVGRNYWQPIIRPLQIVRVGQVASSMGYSTTEDEPLGFEMPKVGDRIALGQRPEPDADDATKTKGYESSPWNTDLSEVEDSDEETGGDPKTASTGRKAKLGQDVHKDTTGQNGGESALADISTNNETPAGRKGTRNKRKAGEELDRSSRSKAKRSDS